MAGGRAQEAQHIPPHGGTGGRSPSEGGVLCAGCHPRRRGVGRCCRGVPPCGGQGGGAISLALWFSMLFFAFLLPFSFFFTTFVVALNLICYVGISRSEGGEIEECHSGLFVR